MCNRVFLRVSLCLLPGILMLAGAADALPVTYHSELEVVVELPPGLTTVGTIAVDMDFDTDSTPYSWSAPPDRAYFAATDVRIHAVSLDSGWWLDGYFTSFTTGTATVEFLDMGGPLIPFLELNTGMVALPGSTPTNPDEFLLTIRMEIPSIPQATGSQIRLPIYEWSDVGASEGSLSYSLGGTTPLTLVNSYTIVGGQTVVPEPATACLFAAGVGLLTVVRRRARRRR